MAGERDDPYSYGALSLLCQRRLKKLQTLE